jgi:hypothetical protein
MSDLETPRTHSLMDRYYEEEREQREREMSLAELSLKLDANDLAFLSMIARRFRKGREDVAQEVLSNALLDLFARIEPSERKLMARDADESAKNNAESIAEENGVRDVEFRSGYWAQQERQITKLEKQREKAEKEAEKVTSKNTVKEAKVSPAESVKAPEPEASTEEYKEEYEEEATHYPETSAIEKAPAALETQVEAANEQDQTEVENASAAE